MNLQPLGHIAGNLHILATIIAWRMNQQSVGRPYACWVDDDGCVYLAPTDHLRAAAMLRHAPEQRVNTYRKPRGVAFPCTANDIQTDLDDARAQHASRTVHQAQEAAV